MAHFAGAVRPPTSVCVTKVELFISCQNLKDKDLTSKSDPVVALCLFQSGRWIEIARTEHIKNNHNPDFSKSLQVDYFFEEVQKLKFSVYDVDNATMTLSDDDFLGFTECTLGEIVSSSTFRRNLRSRHGHSLKSTIMVRAQEIGKGGNEMLHLTFCAKKLDDKDFFSKSDPFLEFRVHTTDGSWGLVHRTEVIKDNLNPKWKPFQISKQSFGGNNPETAILVSCYDYGGNGGHKLIGSFTTSLVQILEAQQHQVEWPCINEKKQQKKGSSYKNSGIIYLTSCKILVA